MAKYQGYPYVSPMVTDVPTIDATRAARWANLPRRPLNPSSPGPSCSGIGTSGVNAPTSSSDPSIPPKVDIDENPVVYIDMPTADGSDVCQSIESPASEEPEFVQNTILYDPFEDRRINVAKDDKIADTLSNMSSLSDISLDNPSPVINQPARPNVLDYGGRGPSSSQSPCSSTPGSSAVPSFMQKETYVYGTDGSDGFPLSPIPVASFPEPPPAYTEFAHPPQSPQSPTQPAPTPEPPRTQVIVPGADPASPIGAITSGRKYLRCQHCGRHVHSLVVKENGYGTYVIAIIFLIFMMPLICIIIFTDIFKYKNHYCPNCNKVIGYVYPIIGENIHYAIS